MQAIVQRSALAIALFAVTAAGHAQVTYMSSVPTVQELKAALAKARSTPAGGSDATLAAPAGRGIEFNPASQAAAIAVARLPAPTDATAAPAGPTAGPAVAMPISFDVNSSRLAGPSAGFVNAVAGLMAQDPSLKLVIEGHTDANGSSTRNLMLSWDRAMAVFRTLVEKHGVDPQRLQPVGRGSLDPLEGMNPAAAVNRRVQFRVTG